MWVVGTVLLFVVGATIGVAIGWVPRVTHRPALWDIPGLSGTYTGIVGTLAGFSVASATFIAGLDYPRESPEFGAVIAMLLISFLILVATAMMYSTTPNAPDFNDDSDSTTQALSNVMANGSYFLGLSLSWLALRPLAQMIGLASLAEAFTWLLLFVVIAGSSRLSLFAYRLTHVNGAACIALPVISIVLATGYWFLADRAWPRLWPATEMPLRFAFVTFVVAATGFAIQTALLVMHGDTRIGSRLQRYGHRLTMAYLQVAMLSVSLTWLAVTTS